MASLSQPWAPLTLHVDKLPFYDCLDGSLPPPLENAKCAPVAARRPPHMTLLRRMPSLGALCPGLSPLSPSSPYLADGCHDGWSEALMNQLLPSSNLRQLSLLRPEVVSPWASATTSPSSSRSSTACSPLSWASAAASPSDLPLPLDLSISSTSSSSSSVISPAHSCSPHVATRAFTFQQQQTAEPMQPRRRYQRTPGLSREQRAERRRQSHRELDAVRRHRDAAAISRLGQLTATAECEQQSRGGSRRIKREADADCAELEADKKGSSSSSNKRHRTAVLEQSVQHLKELQAVVDRLAATCAHQCSDIAALRLQLAAAGVQPQRAVELAAQSPQRLSLLSASMTRRLAGELGVSGLYNALFSSPSVGAMLVDCASGVCVEVNERLVAGGQCTREHIIGRQVAPTYESVVRCEEWDAQPPTPSAESAAATGAESGSSLYSQYGATKEGVLALYRGQVDQVHVVWRARLGDGQVYEVPLSGFIASRDESQGGRPRTLLVTLSMSEAKRI